jgi:predicted amidohydrolase
MLKRNFSIVTNFNIAAAQTIPKKGEIEKNLMIHERLILKAAERGVDLIVFPELSLTGYEPGLAKELAMTFFGPQIQLLISLAARHNIIVIAGAPVQIDKFLYIGAYIFLPDNSVSLYLKHYLHPGEEEVFSPGFFNPHIDIGTEKASLAICADITHSNHAAKAAESGNALYLASVFITPEGYEKDTSLLHKYAQQYNMGIVMANFGGDSGGTQSAGKSAIWSDAGGKVAALEGLGEGLVIAKREGGKWTGKVLQ